MGLVKKSKKRFTRTTANRVLSEVLDRIQAVNANDQYAFRIEAVRLFGSMLMDAKEVGDIDLAMKLVPRYDDQERQRQLCWEKRNERRFSSALQRGMWPYEEVLLAVKGRSPVVSLHKWEEPDELETVSQLVWSAR